MKVLSQVSTQTADNFLKEKSTLEATILEEVRFLQRELSADKCRPISMLNIVSDAVYNIVSAITIGERYMYYSVKLQMVSLKLLDFYRKIYVSDLNLSVYV